MPIGKIKGYKSTYFLTNILLIVPIQDFIISTPKPIGSTCIALNEKFVCSK